MAVARQFEDQREALRLNAWLIGLLPVLYGISTWIFGARLWSDSSLFAHALVVPGAPQSWGTAFIVLGVGSIVSAERSWHRADAAFCVLTALLLAVFMSAFVLSGVVYHLVTAVPPIISYGLFSLLYLGRSRLAWKSQV